MRLAARAVIVALAAAATPAAGQPDDPPAVVCRVDGYDVVILNPGETPLAAGAGIRWSVRIARSEGLHVLSRPLEPGRVVVLTGALGSSFLEPGDGCLAAVDG